MSAQSAAAVARSGACSIQTISSRSLPETGTVHARATRPGNRERIISESYRGHADRQTVVRQARPTSYEFVPHDHLSVAKKNVSFSGQNKPLTMHEF
jgi:hypothetical protein